MSLNRLFLLLPLLLAPPLWADTVSVAVAANFTRPMQVLAEQFEAQSGHQVRLSFGSSGQLFAQIQNGAPFEVLLSADQAKPSALISAGDAVAGSQRSYAIGALALWSATPDRFDDGAALLRSGDFQRLAIANPRLAPYGAAAQEVLQHLQLNQALHNKIVQGQNIAQTYQFVASGNADLGLVALSQILDNGEVRSGTAWIIPTAFYAPIRQDAVLLTPGADKPAARALLDFLASEPARALIASYGYRTEPAL